MLIFGVPSVRKSVNGTSKDIQTTTLFVKSKSTPKAKQLYKNKK